MAIWDKAPVDLVVYEKPLVDDGYGGQVPGVGKAHRIRAFVQPIDADDNSSQGWSEPARYKVITRDAPAERWSHVEMDGASWTVSEIPRLHRGSARTQFVTAVIERRG
ncbi:hypothetical protein [Streptomyces cacaoi]|uniref:Head-tail adaptor protein n=1 Tax=Streptomyces cacaoi TaxID=1898 RepID=A0A4Y3R0Z2_STRCI|nr:hypothetical protein [Streptomyces cacaoi]GEB50443.1 hypothetical protein SCA03_29940 [Streptomyces cacaoi]